MLALVSLSGKSIGDVIIHVQEEYKLTEAIIYLSGDNSRYNLNNAIDL